MRRAKSPLHGGHLRERVSECVPDWVPVPLTSSAVVHGALLARQGAPARGIAALFREKAGLARWRPK